jgi:hypothetical protein
MVCTNKGPGLTRESADFCEVFFFFFFFFFLWVFFFFFFLFFFFFFLFIPPPSWHTAGPAAGDGGGSDDGTPSPAMANDPVETPTETAPPAAAVAVADDDVAEQGTTAQAAPATTVDATPTPVVDEPTEDEPATEDEPVARQEPLGDPCLGGAAANAVAPAEDAPAAAPEHHHPLHDAIGNRRGSSDHDTGDGAEMSVADAFRTAIPAKSRDEGVAARGSPAARSSLPGAGGAGARSPGVDAAAAVAAQLGGTVPAAAAHALADSQHAALARLRETSATLRTASDHAEVRLEEMGPALARHTAMLDEMRVDLANVFRRIRQLRDRLRRARPEAFPVIDDSELPT